MRKKMAMVIVLHAYALLGVALSHGEGFDLQARIDAAAPGEIIEVPVGIYLGNFKLKEGVILAGAGAGATVLNGGGIGPVVEGAPNCVVKGFTITNGLEGVKTNGYLMGVFENIIRDNAGSGICTGGGDCVIVNNLITGSAGKGGIEAGRSWVMAVNNTLYGNRCAFSFWNSGGSLVANNIIALSETGVSNEDSAPDVRHNLFWANSQDRIPWDSGGDNIFSDPLFVDAAGGDYSLLPGSPAPGAGQAVPGLPAELTADIGCRLPSSYPLEMYQTLLTLKQNVGLPGHSSVRYELLDEVGSFRVTTKFSRPAFRVISSTPSTPIDDINAFDSEKNESLSSQLSPEEPPYVEVRGEEGKTYPEEEERYVLESVFHQPESYWMDEGGKIHFQRQTNILKIQVLIPGDYQVESFSPAGGAADPEEGLVVFDNPRGAQVVIAVVFAPGGN